MFEKILNSPKDAARDTSVWLRSVVGADNEGSVYLLLPQTDEAVCRMAELITGKKAVQASEPGEGGRQRRIGIASAGILSRPEALPENPETAGLIFVNSGLFSNASLQRLFDKYPALRTVSLIHAAIPASEAFAVTTAEKKESGLAIRTLINPACCRILNRKGVPVPINIPGHVFLLADGKLTDTGIIGRVNPDRNAVVVKYQDSLPVSGGPLVFKNDLEQFLLRSEDVKDACVLIRPDSSGTPSFFIYISWIKDHHTGALQAKMKESFPEGLAARWEWISLNNLPLSGEGSIGFNVLEQYKTPDAALLASVITEVGRASGGKADMVLTEAPFRREWYQTSGFLGPAGPARPERKGSGLPEALSEGPELTFGKDEPLWLGDLLRRAARMYPGHGIRYIEGDATETGETYAELLVRAEEIAGALLTRGFRQNSYVIGQLQSLKDTVTLFWACQIAGLVAVPLAYPKDFSEENEQIRKLKNVVRILGKPAIVHDEAFAAALPGPALSGAVFSALCYTELKTDGHVPVPQPDPDPENVAVVLFTSGSTGIPKGVQLCHRNIVARSKGTSLFNSFTPADVSLNWMPLDHVGGIIMYHVRSVFNGCRQIVANTSLVVADPVLWLEWISRYRVTDTWAPNFAFAMIADADLSAHGHLDLTSIRHILNGGESISFPVTEKFLRKLAPFGLKSHSIFPSFGMSETSSGITHSHLLDGEGNGSVIIFKHSTGGELEFASRNGTDTVQYVEVGAPIPGARVRIVDEENRLKKECHIGRVQIGGLTINKGYLNNPDANKAFVGDGWFNTGDLGFLRNGKLTITGRANDVIIINGVNHYNHEIEAVAARAKGVKANCTIAVGRYNRELGSEELILFYVPEDPHDDQVRKEIFKTLIRESGVTPREVIRLDAGQFPVTPNGKKQRAVVLGQLEEGLFDDQLKFRTGDLPSEHKFPAWFFKKEMQERTFSEGILPDERPCIFLIPENDLLHIEAAVPATLKNVSYIPFVPEHDGQTVLEPALENELGRNTGSKTKVVLFSPVTPGTTHEQLKNVFTRQGFGFFMALLRYFQRREIKPAEIRVVSSCRGTADPFGEGWDGLISTAMHEFTWLNASRISVDRSELTCIRDLCRELQYGQHYRKVILRNGKRYVEFLTPAAVPEPQPSALIPGGFYVVTGGLGGIGFELCSYLLRRYGVKLLLTGKTDIFTDKEQTGERISAPDKRKNRKEAYEMLSRYGDIRYVPAEISDPEQVSRLFEEEIKKAGRRPDGILHLAGEGNLEYHWQHAEEHRMLNEKAETFEWMFRPKVLGTANLLEQAKKFGISQFISFSSSIVHFGSAGFSAYATANGLLQGLTDPLLNPGTAMWTIAWTQWNNIGMSCNNPFAGLSEEIGFHVIPVKAGLASFEVALSREPGFLLAGLNPGKPAVTGELSCLSPEMTGGIGYTGRPLSPELQDTWSIRLKARGATVLFRHFDELPDPLRITHMTPEGKTLPAGKPATDTEVRLYAIWERVLGTTGFSVYDNFFELGGHSIKATQLAARIADTFNTKTGLQDIFNTATIRQLGQLIDREGRNSKATQIAKAPVMEHYPVSAAQYRTWVLHKMVNQSVAYNIPAAIEIRGPFNADAFREAIRQILRRHEILRTVFIEVDREPRQKVLDTEIEIPLIEKEQTTTPAAEIEKEIRELSLMQFDLENGPLVRFRIWRFSNDLSVAFFNIHHIIADGTSINLIFKEIAAVYRATVHQGKAGLPDLAIQYKDYSFRQNQFLKDNPADAQYWREKLSGKLNVFNLPSDFDRPDRHTYAGDICHYTIPAELASRLDKLAKDNGGSLFMLLTAMLNVYLHRLTGETDIIVGTGADMRSSVQLENQVGQYINLLALRSAVDPAMSFSELLRQVRETVTEAIDHMEYPYERIIEEVALDRTLNRNPLFNVQIIMQNFRQVPLQIDHLQIKKLQVPFEASKFDMTFSFHETAGGIESIIRYNTGLFLPERIAHMAKQLIDLSEQISIQPEKPVGLFSLAKGDESFLSSLKAPQIREEFTPVHEFLAQHAKAFPGNTAVEYGTVQLSYAEVYRISTGISRFVEENYPAARVVALWFSPGVELVTAMAGVMDSGRVFMPVDARFPKKRKQNMLKACTPDLIFCVPDDMTEVLDTAGNISPQTGIATIFYEDGSTGTEVVLPFTGLSPHAEIPGWSYVYFTSGTTGMPKPIAGSGNSLSHFIHWERSLIAGKRQHRVAQLTQLTFDASLRDIWFAWTTGSVLCIPPGKIREDIQLLFEWLNENNIDVLHTVPSMLKAIVSVAGNKTLRSVKHLLLAGEPVRNDDLLNWYRHLPGEVSLYNLYGATETTLVKTCKKLSPEDASRHVKVSVGRPIPGTQIIIARDHQLCAIGETGELYIRTPYMSLGYLNQDDKNRSAFVQNPLHNDYPDIVYATGDTARYNLHLEAEIIGRRDEQLKINGVRIEPAEIEHAIRDAGAADAVVVPDDWQKPNTLYCFYTCSRGELMPDKLRAAAAEVLPAFMVPSRFEKLDRIPLNANGKTDRHALRLSEAPVQPVTETETAPENAREMKKIWEEVLGTAIANEQLSFFELGGNSLSAMILLSIINQRFEVKIAIDKFFEKPTIRATCDALAQDRPVRFQPIEALPDAPGYAVSHAQKRMWLLQEIEKESITYNVKRAFLLEGKLDIEILRKTVTGILSRHESLRTTFIHTGAALRQVVHPVAALPGFFEWLDFGEEDDAYAKAVSYVTSFYGHVFDLSKAPLILFKIIHLADDRHVFSVVMHHIISDGWSMEVLSGEIITGYNKLQSGQPCSPAPLSIQYRDYAGWQNRLLESADIEEHRQYWMSQFEGEIPVLNLPVDFPRFRIKTFNGDIFKFTIDQPVYRSFRTLCDSEGCTLFMGLLAAFKLLLYRYTGQTDIINGTPTAGRDHVGLQDQLGFYVNTLAIRNKLNPSGSFLELLQDVKEKTVGAYKYQAYPFDRLVDDLNLVRYTDHSPLFDVVVQQMNVFAAKDSDRKLNGITIRDFKPKWQTSQFDLSVFFTEEHDSVSGVIEYNTDLFLTERISRMKAHFMLLLSQIVRDRHKTLDAYRIVTDEEKDFLLNRFNDTRCAYPREATIGSLFTEAVQRFRERTVIADAEGTYTYGQLEACSDRIAALLGKKLAGRGEKVVLLLDPGMTAVAAMLAVLKSGNAYVPVSPAYPRDRILFIVRDCGASCVVSEKKYIKILGEALWDTSAVKTAICMDSEDATTVAEPENHMMSAELWNHVGRNASDDITGGAWFSGFTGQALSRHEMDEYAGNVYSKLKKYLHPDVRILEVGCSSGITMFRLAPEAGFYMGTDISSVILKGTAAELARRNLHHTELRVLPAHAIGSIGGRFDIVIINSVVQCFGGYNYLTDVLRQAQGLLNPEGIVFLGDIQDAGKKVQMLDDLEAWHRDKPGSQTKLDWSNEFFVSRTFVEQLPWLIPEYRSAEVSEKTGAIENELTRYRYDAILSKRGPAMTGQAQKELIGFDPHAAAGPASATVHPDDTAYIIYTSGSTGQPKGCMVTHRNLVRLFVNEHFPFHFSEQDTWIQAHGSHFDFSVWEIYGALLYGAKLVIPTAAQIREPASLYGLIRAHRVTVLNQTPLAFRYLSGHILQASDGHDLSEHLRYVIFGGDKLIPSSLEKWSKKFPIERTRLINMYGITETTVHVTFCRISQEDIDSRHALSPLGAPLPETGVYLLSENKTLQPQGVVGEIAVSGSGVCRGYLNRDELTAGRFIDNPFREGERLYLSGDLGMIGFNGQLMYIGRKDHQVKIRGYRIELHEIEKQLRKVAGISDCAVISMQNRSGENEIIAYYVTENTDPEMIAARLKQYLPDYMLPAGYCRIESLPLTISGKLDRSRLPDPWTGGTEKIVEKAGTATEAAVMEVMQEVLGIGQIGLNANFFEEGGNSLKTMSMMSLLHARLRIGVPLAVIYESPTPKAIANYIDCARYMNIQYREHPYILLGDESREHTIFLFPPALGSALAYGHLASLLTTSKLYSFNYVDNTDTLQNYVRLFNELQPEGSFTLAGHSAGGFMAFHMAEALEKAGRQVDAVIILDAFREHKEGKLHTYETIMEGVDLYMQAKFEEFENSFINMDFFKEICYKQVIDYYHFLYQAEKESKTLIHAPIHFLIAENHYDRKENWSASTHNKVYTYFAKGVHGKMVDEPWVKGNAGILDAIVEQVKQPRPTS